MGAVGSFLATAGVTIGGVLLLGSDPGRMVGNHVSRSPLLFVAIVFGFVIARRARGVAVLEAYIRDTIRAPGLTGAPVVVRILNG